MLNFLSLIDQLFTCLPDEGEIDGREQTKVSKGQEGTSFIFLAHQYIMISVFEMSLWFFGLVSTQDMYLLCTVFHV